jgi:pantoate--beta-alanine ligase
MTDPKDTEIAHDLSALRAAVAAWRKDGARIALVPTLGALHDGHLTLVRAAKERADRVVVSIFVNPAQFAPHEDFARYPRDLEGDRAKLQSAGGVDLIYAPRVQDMFTEGAATRIVVGGPAHGLESDFRPHFFSGVATVVAKLFIQCAPDIAVFGEKDYQQLLVVRRMAADLDLNLEILGVPTVREADGLALSSRNAYLTAAQRPIAARLNRTLRAVAARVKDGVSVPQCEAEGAAQLIEAGFAKVDYVAVRDAETLSPVRDLTRPARVLAAAHLSGVRLIDNLAV